MTDREDTVSRRGFITGVAAVGAASVAPSQALTTDSSTHLDEYTGLMTDIPSEINRYGSGGWPGWIVGYDSSDSDAFNALEDWTTGDKRELVKHDSDSARALVAAPPKHVVDTALFGGGGDLLATRDYVETLAIDVRMDVPEPVGHLSEESSFTAPESLIPVDGAFDQSDVAYSSDVSKSTMADVRSAIDVGNVSETGSGVTVAVVDDGVDVASDSSVFGSRITAAKNFLSGETGISNVGSAGGHGTWVASAIAANPSDSTYQGVAPAAELLVAKVLGDDGGSTHDVAAGIRWSARNGADVINASLGSHLYSPEVVQAIRDALDNGVTAVMVAAGNSRQTTRWVDSPASSLVDVDGALAVGATTVAAPGEAQSVYFSSVGEHDGYTDRAAGETRGGTVEVAAPGAKIEALVPTSSGGTTTATKSGTSMASPAAAGVIALALESNAWTPSEAETQVTDTAQPIPAAGVTEVGWGMIHASNLLSGTQPDRNQADARSDAAENRDLANRSLSGNQSRLAPLRHVIDI